MEDLDILVLLALTDWDEGYRSFDDEPIVEEIILGRPLRILGAVRISFSVYEFYNQICRPIKDDSINPFSETHQIDF